MPYVVIRAKVADYARWKPVFDADSDNRKAGGSRGGQLFRDSQNPNEVILLFQWDSLEHAGQFMQSPGLREKMQQSGVVGQPDVYFLEKVEDVER